MRNETVFVTGATGLLGNNLVRQLLLEGANVRALVRSADKARAQFADLPGADLEIVLGDLADVDRFAPQLRGVTTLFHTAAYFRESYKGGNHRETLIATNQTGTDRLVHVAYGAGIRRIVQTSSIAVLDGPRGALIDETMLRKRSDADDYYLSKILADEAVFAALDRWPDLHASFVLPAWMWGPGDAGPTSAGQTALDFLNQRLPGIPPATFSLVDARDVAATQIAAAKLGRRGERYLAAGRNMSLTELFPLLERVSGVPAPRLRLPIGLLFIIAGLQEGVSRLTGKPVLLSWAAVKNMARESGRTRFSSAKSEQELGLRFRPADETLADTVAWFRVRGLAPAATSPSNVKRGQS
jgi:dihydroflavonol-4-reductase